MKIDLNILREKNTQWVILILLGVLIMFFLYLNLIFKPTIAGLQNINPKLTELKKNIETVEALVKKQEETKREFEKLQYKMRYYENMLSGEEQIPSLLEELSGMARESNVKIIGIKPTKLNTSKDTVKKEVVSRIRADAARDANKEAPKVKKAKASYHEIPISVEAKCGYHQLGVFISKLENANRLLVVNDIEIKTDPMTPREHNVSLIVSAFLMTEE
ncbi:MAG: hypothetical protein COS99_04485 [Candidatus Omnitrophica bacterium CG07_land_8_20_14_0_80_42_15]|uniref:Pilus assembly protein PilO n=1 Tax=Candidatus Aquitaenariimonas noxiae TaxID=1974741 RepID=A0A2J0KW79_9BACT|nr:MAG: hypothetical protein COS99_04485 [Candidatus Omnitrophica bacterium CG07_land_8_20_14_0_80_42_15]